MAPRGNEWTGLDAPAGFERCVRGSVRELYGYLALLTGPDRVRTEQMVTDVYRSLFRAAAAGQLETVRLGALRSAARRLWLERNDAELARPARLSPAPVRSIAELSVIERAVVVLRHVNGMSDARTGSELGRPAGEVEAVSEHAIRRLRGTTGTSGEATGAWLRAYFDSSVAPRAGLVDRIVAELGPSDDTPAQDVDEPTAPMPVIVPTDPTEPADPADAEIDDASTAPVPVTIPADVGSDSDADFDDSADDRSLADLASVGLTGAAIRPDVDLVLGGDEPTDEVPAATDGEVAWAVAPDDDPTWAATGDDPASPATTDLPATQPDAASAHEAPLARPPAPPTRRRWWPVALVAVLALALIALWWLFVRDDDAGTVASDPSGEPTGESVDTSVDMTLNTTSATDPGAAPVTNTPATSPSTSPSTLPSTGPSTVAATTEPGATPAPAAAPVLLDGESSDRFEPPCAAWYALPTPASPPLPATFGPLGAEPAVTVEIPVVTDGVGATIVEPAGAGLLLGVVQNDADGTAAATVLARVGIDGVVHWVRCYDEVLIVNGEPNADIAAAVGRVVDGQLGWYTVSMADGDVSTEVDPVTGLALDVLYERGPVEPSGPTVAWRDGVLTGLGVGGGVVWTDPEMTERTTEGFSLAVGGDVAIVFACGDDACTGGTMRGYDVARGELLWERADTVSVAALADGYALVLGPQGWELVTATDGVQVPGQVWPDPARFETRCCGEGEIWFTERIGGLVVTAREGGVDLWLPVDAGDGITLVDLAPPV